VENLTALMLLIKSKGKNVVTSKWNLPSVVRISTKFSIKGVRRWRAVSSETGGGGHKSDVWTANCTSWQRKFVAWRQWKCKRYSRTPFRMRDDGSEFCSKFKLSIVKLVANFIDNSFFNIHQIVCKLLLLT